MPEAKPTIQPVRRFRTHVRIETRYEASVRQNTTDPKYLYHYTTPQAASSIAESSQITGSSVGLAGSGTYLTAKPPRTRTNDLLQNNYASTTVCDSSYVDQYVRVEADDLGARHVGEDRDVWRVNGNVDLLSYNGFVAARSPKRSRRSTGAQPFGKEYADGLH